jgi:hypothetical protein
VIVLNIIAQFLPGLRNESTLHLLVSIDRRQILLRTLDDMPAKVQTYSAPIPRPGELEATIFVFSH